MHVMHWNSIGLRSNGWRLVKRLKRTTRSMTSERSYLHSALCLVVSVVLVTAVIATISCGAGGDNGGGGSSSNGLTLLGPTFTNLAPLSSVTDQLALPYFAGAPLQDCYPGSKLTFSAYKLFRSDPLQGQVVQPIDTSALTWSSDNTSIATVTNGTVSCVGQGTAKISATLPNATCEFTGCTFSTFVVVGPSKHTLAITPASGTFHVGDAINFTVIMTTEFPNGTSTQQDVSSSIQVAHIDSLRGKGTVLTLAATSATTNNQFKATASGTDWGFATYRFSDHDAVSNVYAINVQ